MNSSGWHYPFFFLLICNACHEAPTSLEEEKKEILEEHKLKVSRHVQGEEARDELQEEGVCTKGSELRNSKEVGRTTVYKQHDQTAQLESMNVKR